jgi:hypothetical protein
MDWRLDKSNPQDRAGVYILRIGFDWNGFVQRPATGPRDQFFRLLGIYFINMELIWPDYFSHTVLEF